MLKQRVITASILIPPVFVCLYYGGAYLSILGALLFLIINFEFLAFSTKLSKKRVCEFVFASSLIPVGYLYNGFTGVLWGLLIAFLAYANLLVWLSNRQAEHFERTKVIPAAFISLLYTGLLGSIPFIASRQDGGNMILTWVLLVVIAADTFAYFGGRSIGGKKLAPLISPNKTISGAVCGMLGAGLVAYLARDLVPMLSTAWECFAIGLIAAYMAVLGDLFESLMKRIYDVKDSGSLLPGHGGLLDRVDGFIFASVLVFELI